MTMANVCPSDGASLAVHAWPCTGKPVADTPVVLLHGWGSDGSVWNRLAQELRERFRVLAVDLPGFGDSPPGSYDLPQLLAQLAQTLPERVILVGWSLGGMLVTAYAARWPRRVAQLVTLSANATFIRRPGWPSAMPRRTFAAFCEDFDADPAAACRQFHGLQARGDNRERQVLRDLRKHPVALGSSWQNALRLLGELDNRRHLASLAVPALHLFGERDILVPPAAARAMADACPGARVKVLPGIAHVPHYSDPATTAEAILTFLDLHQVEKYEIDKAQVARSFGRAAGTYDSAAALQRRVGEDLIADLARLEGGAGPRLVADLGCGTGHFCERLARHYPRSTCIGLDLAEGMVVHARDHRPEVRGWLCADAEQLPLAAGSLDLVFSNFTFQWCQQLPALMAELGRALKPGGVLAFTTVGPESLRELRRAWLRVDRYAHVNRFESPGTIRAAVASSGFAMESFAVEQCIKYHPDLKSLTRELKNLGAHNVNQGRNVGLTGRRRLQAFREAYEAQRTDRGLPATWEVIRVVAVKS
jgi:malonyl-CoA O-methyltransferase